MARAARTGTATRLTVAGTILTRGTRAVTAAGGALRHCPRCSEESPSYVDFICGKGGVIDTWLNGGARRASGWM